MLSQGLYATVDDEDFPLINRYSWSARWDHAAGLFYAVTNVRKLDGKKTLVSMHHLVMLSKPRTLVDHKNHDTLDNRRSNLRIASHLQNVANSRIGSNNTSGYKGVTYRGRSRKWAARVRSKGKEFYLGLFHSPIEAAKAYNEKAKSLFGEFAFLNPLPNE